MQQLRDCCTTDSRKYCSVEIIESYYTNASQVLLKKKLPDLPELEAKLKVCEENGLQDEVPVLDTQVLCCKSLRMTESYTQCKVCEVRYSDEIVQPTICIFCMMGRIATQKDRVSPRLPSKDTL